MKCLPAKSNDGTIAITKQVKQPMQGTWVSEVNGKKVLAKGIVRPPLKHGGFAERETVFSDSAAFGRSIAEAPEGVFFRVKEVGKERCGLGYQAILFSTAKPAQLIRNDTKRIRHMTALDLLGAEGKRKVLSGVPASMLVQHMAPWDMLRRFAVAGVRATVYGSLLVKGGGGEDTSLELAFMEAGRSPRWRSHFMLLPDSAAELARQAHCPVDKLVGQTFIIHRDPALPDGTSMFKATFQGICEWDAHAGGHGVIIHPEDPNWKAAGGDMDGDAASVLVMTGGLEITAPKVRTNYRLNKPTYASDCIREQMIEAAENAVTGLLGPIILASMKIKERGLDTSQIMSVAAGLAQASVEAKKHAVDQDTVVLESNNLFEWVRQGSNGGITPYLSEFTNELRNASGLDGKMRAWQTIKDFINLGLWVNGTDIERAMVDRINAIDVLFSEVEYFQNKNDRQLPRNIIDGARGFVDTGTELAIRGLSEQYRQLVRDLYEDNGFEDIKDDDALSIYARDELRKLSEKFRYFCATGVINNSKVDLHVAHCAMVGYGPQTLAARYVPADIFEELGHKCKKIILAVMDSGWEDGEYNIADVKPIPSCSREFKHFAKGLTTCLLEVIHFTGKCTRVVLTGMPEQAEEAA